MDNRVCMSLELVKSRSIQTDSSGNWILWAEASNENLDFQGQVVLQDALKKSESYFLKNGVISYDHRHLHADAEDPTWNPEKYIIGEPLAVQTKGTRTMVQFKLYKSNPLAQELVQKIQDGSTRVKTSIAGKMPQVVREFSQKLGRAVEVVKGVLWDELAITFKPVNQTLAPITTAALVKSLTATPMSTDSSARVGGAAMIAQGHVVKEKKPLRKAGDEEDDEGESEMDDNLLQKSLDDSIADLEKALKGGGKQASAVAHPDRNVAEDEYDGPDGEDGTTESADDDEDRVDVDGYGTKGAPRTRLVKKSIEQSVRDAGQGDALDVSEFLATLTKSISDKMDEIQATVESGVALQKSIAKSIVAQAQMTKSLGNAPAPRAGAVTRAPRQFGQTEDAAGNAGVTPQFLLAKAQAGVAQGKVDSRDFTKLQMRLNKGQMPEQGVIDFLKSL